MLAEEIGCTLKDLAHYIGISPAMLFAARSGKQPVSLKTWSKLECAEKKAGLKTVYPQGKALSDAVQESPSEQFGVKVATEMYLSNALGRPLTSADYKKTLSEILEEILENSEAHPDAE